MPFKASSLKKAASTQKKHEIQLGLKIKNNDNTIDIHDQIHTLTAN